MVISVELLLKNKFISLLTQGLDLQREKDNSINRIS